MADASSARPGHDREFADLIARGDRDGAARLAHGACAANVARGLGSLTLKLGGSDEADAIVNWAVCRAVLKGGDFDPARGSLERWLFAIARARALSLLRRVKTSREVGTGEADRTQDVEQVYQRNEALQRVLRRMNDLHRRLLLVDLAHDGQATAVAAGHALGIPSGTVYKHRCRARKIFRELWIQETGVEGGP